MRSLNWPTSITLIMFVQGHYFICPHLPVTLNWLACVMCRVHWLICFHTPYCRVCYLQLLYLFHQSNTCFCTICMLNAVHTRNVINPDKSFLMPLLQVGQQFTKYMRRYEAVDYILDQWFSIFCLPWHTWRLMSTCVTH